MNLPKEFLDNISRIWGIEGRVWLHQLPTLIEQFAAQWQLTDITHFENLSFNYVAHAYSDLFKKQVVLKIGAPHPYFINELRALEYYKGNGAVNLLASDADNYAMLMERVIPGTTARSLFPAHDDKAVEYACTVIQKLHTQPLIGQYQFETIETWFDLFNTLTIPSDLQPLVNRAKELVKELESTPQPLYLLHGDLHHDNILLNGNNTPISIDPKGVIGERAYEPGAFMCNPAELCEQSDVRSLLNRRLDLFAKLLDIDHQRLAKACYARIILSCCWTVQAKGNWQDDAMFAKMIIPS